MPLFIESAAARGVRGMFFLAAVVLAAPAAATTFFVDTPVDLPDGNILDGICSYMEAPDPNIATCSLRAAVTQANAITDDPDPVTIHLLPGETYYIGGGHDPEVSGRVGDLDISRPMLIGVAPIFERAKIRRTSGSDRLFEIHPGAGGTRIFGVQMKNSQLSSGGCIVHAQPGAGALSLDHLELLDSNCSAYGVIALYNKPTTIEHTEIHHGQRALWISGADVTIRDSSVYTMEALPTVVLTNNATATFINSTFSDTYKPLTANQSNLFVIGSTFTNSEAEHIAFKTNTPGRILRLDNTLFSGAGAPSCLFYAGNSDTPLDNQGATLGIVDIGGSVFDDASCVPNNNPSFAPNLYNAFIALSSLGNHGGPTSTHTLLPVSDGIDWIAPQHCQSNGKDQRGLPRAVAYSGVEPAHCDAGATELQLVEAPPQGQIFSDGLEGD